MSDQSATAISSPIQDYLQELHACHTALRDGQVATYIPELAKANPDWFGICLVTTEGHVYEVGDSRQHFTFNPFPSRSFMDWRLRTTPAPRC